MDLASMIYQASLQLPNEYAEKTLCTAKVVASTPSGKRRIFSEVNLYQVARGKVVMAVPGAAVAMAVNNDSLDAVVDGFMVGEETKKRQKHVYMELHHGDCILAEFRVRNREDDADDPQSYAKALRKCVHIVQSLVPDVPVL